MARRWRSSRKLPHNLILIIKRLRLLKSNSITFIKILTPVFIFLVIFASVPIFSIKKESIVTVPYSVQKAHDPTLELNDSMQKQAGINGTKSITYGVSKSLFNIIFGGEKGEAAISSKITKAPTPRIIASGTKKYQYMYCSNGGYRYYTDAQFKNPMVGFTHKSPDYCAKNNQGAETQLASVPPRSNANNTAIPFTPISMPSCTTTSIPYSVTYEDVSWLPVGQTETFQGLNGTYFSCIGSTVQPINEKIYVGIGQNYNYVSQQAAQTLARQDCTQQYNSAMAILGANGAGFSSAADEVKMLYSQCLSAAG